MVLLLLMMLMMMLMLMMMHSTSLIHLLINLVQGLWIQHPNMAILGKSKLQTRHLLGTSTTQN